MALPSLQDQLGLRPLDLPREEIGDIDCMTLVRQRILGDVQQRGIEGFRFRVCIDDQGVHRTILAARERQDGSRGRSSGETISIQRSTRRAAKNGSVSPGGWKT